MKTKISSLLLLTLCGLLFSGCIMWQDRRHAQATSLMQFLYPKDAAHVDAPGVPVLSLPLRVGIAFVPPAAGSFGNGTTALTEAEKAGLLRRVAAEFKGLPYVKSIEVIPTAYLRPGGGFDNLDQLKAMFGVDVIALVSYDQVQFTNEGFLSIAYWTVVGAYVVEGEKNDTQTLMDAAVYDIASHKLLFRAPGTSQVKASATPVNESEQLQTDSGRGFDEATKQLVANLKTELENFRTRVKESPDEFKIERKPGYTGSGAIDGWFVGALAGTALLTLRRRK